MAVPVESVTPDKCFVTPRNQVRRVLAVDGGPIDYEARGSRVRKGKWPLRYTADIERFAADVVKEVPCHDDPDFGATGAGEIVRQGAGVTLLFNLGAPVFSMFAHGGTFEASRGSIRLFCHVNAMLEAFRVEQASTLWRVVLGGSWAHRSARHLRFASL